MKKLTLAIAALVMATGAQAQMNVKLGVAAGLNISNMKYQEVDFTKTIPTTTDKNGDMKIGGKAGLVLDLGFNDKLSLQPALFYSMKGFKSNTESTYDFMGQTAVQKDKNNNTFHYVELPVNVAYRFGSEWSSTRFMIYAGPYVAYAIGGQRKTEQSLTLNGVAAYSGDTTRKLTFGNENTNIDMTDPFNPVTKQGDDLKALDYGFQVGAGVEMNSGLFFQAQYQMGAANLANDFSYKIPGASQSSSGSANNWVIGISVGYYFMNSNRRY